jgi:cellulose synthase/poly-beta-1,6-N-acetylglucosamine synthase-like glycosyltransferase
MAIHAGCDWLLCSDFLIRLEALQELRGFPETSIAEDVLFSWILLAHGWLTIYNNAKLQYSLQLNSLAIHIPPFGRDTKRCWPTGTSLGSATSIALRNLDASTNRYKHPEKLYPTQH